MSTWQPIETAPEDGSVLLGWDSDEGDYVILEYISDLVGYWLVCKISADEAWSGLDGISHWMPLPAPPEATP